jgi:elongation factor P
MHIEVDGDLYTVVEAQHVKIGRGSAYVRAKIRNMRTGAIVERKFNAGERVPRAYLETKEMQYLYHDGDGYHLMDSETYEQIALPSAVVGEANLFLKDGMTVGVVFYEGSPLEVELPNSVELTVVETSPGVRGDTVSGGSKPAKLETGAIVQVPLFVAQGERIRVDTRTGQYLERVR